MAGLLKTEFVLGLGSDTGADVRDGDSAWGGTVAHCVTRGGSRARAVLRGSSISQPGGRRSIKHSLAWMGRSPQCCTARSLPNCYVDGILGRFVCLSCFVRRFAYLAWRGSGRRAEIIIIIIIIDDCTALQLSPHYGFILFHWRSSGPLAASDICF